MFTLTFDVQSGGLGYDDDKRDAVIALCLLWLRLTIVRAEPKISAAAATFVPQSGEIQFEILV